MRDECVIRRMTERDLDEVMQIDQSSFARPWPRTAYEHELRDNKCARYLVAEKNGRVIGFGGGWVVLDESQITNIAVTASERGHGYGKLLTRELLQYLSNLGAVMTTLEVRESNLCAQHVYQSLGFFRVGRRKRYYEDNGEDAFIMLCDHLPPADEDFAEPESVIVESEDA